MTVRPTLASIAERASVSRQTASDVLGPSPSIRAVLGFEDTPVAQAIGLERRPAGARGRRVGVAPAPRAADGAFGGHAL